MLPCGTEHGEIGNPQRFFTRPPMPNVTPHTEMINDLLKLAVDSGVSDVIAVIPRNPGHL